MEPFFFHIKIPDLPKTRNSLGDRRWTRKRESDKWRDLVALYTANKRPKMPLKKVKLRLIRHSAVCPDYDGLVSSFKYVIDAFVKLKIIEDDSMKHIVEQFYGWKKGKKKKGFVEVFLEEVKDAE